MRQRGVSLFHVKKKWQIAWPWRAFPDCRGGMPKLLSPTSTSYFGSPVSCPRSRVPQTFPRLPRKSQETLRVNIEGWSRSGTTEHSKTCVYRFSNTSRWRKENWACTWQRISIDQPSTRHHYVCVAAFQDTGQYRRGLLYCILSRKHEVIPYNLLE